LKCLRKVQLFISVRRQFTASVRAWNVSREENSPPDCVAVTGLFVSTKHRGTESPIIIVHAIAFSSARALGNAATLGGWVGRTWLRASSTRDDSACAMARNAARSENARDPPRRRERPKIRSLAGSQTPLYFTRLSREKRGGSVEQSIHTGDRYIGYPPKKLSRHWIFRVTATTAKFATPIGAEFSLRRADINLISNGNILHFSCFLLLTKIASIRETSEMSEIDEYKIIL